VRGEGGEARKIKDLQLQNPVIKKRGVKKGQPVLATTVEGVRKAKGRREDKKTRGGPPVGVKMVESEGDKPLKSRRDAGKKKTWDSIRSM